MTNPFLDTNILLRHLRQDHPVLSPKATAILRRIEEGSLSVRISDTVLFETVFTLERGYKESRERIAEALLPLLELPGVVLPGKRAYRRIFALYRNGGLGFADCYHIDLMNRLRIQEILSFDTHFDKATGISRREE